jgi:hypothetical protein
VQVPLVLVQAPLIVEETRMANYMKMVNRLHKEELLLTQILRLNYRLLEDQPQI